MTLTWGQILTLTFQNQISFEAPQREKHDDAIADSFFTFISSKVIREKYFACLTSILTKCDLWRLNHWPEVTFDDLIRIRVQKLSNCFIYVLLAIIFPDATARFLKKILSHLLTIDDLWWPQYCSERKHDQNTLNSTYWELSNAFYRVFLIILVFELEGGGDICPPPTMAKLADIATGARVKNVDLLAISLHIY